MVSEVDGDGDGNIDLLEFCRTISTKLKRPTEDKPEESGGNGPVKPLIRQPTGGGRRSTAGGHEDSSAVQPTEPEPQAGAREGTLVAQTKQPAASGTPKVHIKQPTAKRAQAKVRQPERPHAGGQ
jgi:hypothetical protein